MKMKMFTMLAALSLSATAVFAQKGVEDGSRFGHGEDSLRCPPEHQYFILNM